MLEDIGAQMKVFIGLIGATVAACIGAAVRQFHHPDGFSFVRAAVDLPFAVLCALIAGGIGELLTLPAVVVYALAGSAGYLGPKWLGDFLKKRAEEKLGKGGDDAARADQNP